jgi:hypothetical protein
VADRINLAKAISRQSGVAVHPAAPELLSALQELHAPDSAVAFFREFEPAECAEIDGVRLWPVKEVLAENKDYVPGCFIIQHGYVVFATTLFGDAFCFDTNEGRTQEATPIVLIAHDWDWDEISPEAISRLKKATAPNFEAFLRAYVDGTLDIQPNYDPFP